MARKLGGLLFASILAAGLLAAPGFSQNKAGTAAKGTALRAKLKVISRQITQVRTQLHETKQKKRRISEQLHATEIRLQFNQDRLHNVRLKMDLTSNQIAVVTKRLKETREKLAEHNKMLASRLRTIYRHGPVSYVSVLLDSKSFSDYMDRKYYVSRAVNGDVSLINEIKRETEEIRQDKATLETKQRNLTTLEGQLAVQSQLIAQDAQEKKDLLDQVEGQREMYQQAQDELEQQSQQIENMIMALQSTPAGRARALKPFRGGFIRPVSGGISSSFGYRVHPILHTMRLHTGVDLRASSGTRIKAAAGGVVILAGWNGPYGNSVIIDHGGGVSTLYGHCSSLCVSTGQSVSQGQMIGRVGSTGWSTGPHLHFEKRMNGKPVSPL